MLNKGLNYNTICKLTKSENNLLFTSVDFIMFSYCLNFLLNQWFFSPFFNFSGGSKPKLYAKITLVIVSAVTTAVFIAFCIVLGLLIKGNVSSVKQ